MSGPQTRWSRAADLIERRGLAKGRYLAEPGGPVCILGALAIATGTPEDDLYAQGPAATDGKPPHCEDIPGYSELRGWLAEHPSTWNDSGATTDELAVRKLRGLHERAVRRGEVDA